MKSNRNFLILVAALPLLLTPKIQGQTTSPPYLSQFPSIESIKADVKGIDAMETTAKQAGIFWQLRQLIYNLALSQRRTDRQFTPDEQRLEVEYRNAHYRAIELFEGKVTGADKPKWFELRGKYEMDLWLRDEVFKKYFTPDLRRAVYVALKGQMPTENAPEQSRLTPPAASLGTAARPSTSTASSTSQPSSSAGLSPEAYNAQGDKYLTAQNFAKAIEAYNRAIAIDPSYASAYAGLATSYFATEKWQLAVASFQKFQTLGKMNASLLYLLGRAHSELKQYEQALKVFRSIIDLQPAAQDLAFAHYGIGTTYWSMGQYQDAVSTFETALRNNPNDANAHRELGNSYYGLKQYPNALTAVQQAIRLNPKNASSFRALGYIYVKMGKKQEAMQAYRTLLTLNNEMAQQLYAEINKPQPSANIGTAADQPETKSAEAYVAEGIRYHDEKDYVRAIEAFKKAIALNPKISAAYHKLAGSYFLLDRDQEALLAIKEAIRLNPNVSASHLLLGTIHFDLQQYEQALPALQQAIRLKPDLALAHFYLGRTYLGTGRKQEALKVYRTLVSLDKERAQRLYAEINNAK